MPVSSVAPIESHGAVRDTATPRTVGLWLELSLAEFQRGSEDERVRLARCLATGLGRLAEVGQIIVPCQPQARTIVATLFTDPARPGRFVADSLLIVPAGGDRRRIDACDAWLERRHRRCLEKLAAMHAAPHPRSWHSSLRRLREDRRGRRRTGLALARRMLRLARFSTVATCLAVARSLVQSMPRPHVGIARDLRRRGMSALWLAMPAATTATRLLQGPVVALGGDASGGMHRVPDFASGFPPAVMPPIWHDDLNDADSRRLLADELRGHFRASQHGKPHRHFCDFPFERTRYVLVPVQNRPVADVAGVLRAYAHMLRRQRRELKLVLAGHGAAAAELHEAICHAGLVFDVVEIVGLSEAARARLIRHADVVVVPPGNAPVPTMAGEALGLKTPVVLASGMDEAWPIAETPAGMGSHDSDAGNSAPSDVRLASRILAAIDHRAEVSSRQQALVAQRAQVSWTDVARTLLDLEQSPTH